MCKLCLFFVSAFRRPTHGKLAEIFVRHYIANNLYFRNSRQHPKSTSIDKTEYARDSIHLHARLTN